MRPKVALKPVVTMNPAKSSLLVASKNVPPRQEGEGDGSGEEATIQVEEVAASQEQMSIEHVTTEEVDQSGYASERPLVRFRPYKWTR